MSKEPTYTKQEQAERLQQFERWVEQARESWRQGYAVILMGYDDYCELLKEKK